MIDQILCGLIIVAAIFGLIRGVVSQIMSLIGLAAAYFASPWVGANLGSWVQGQLGCSRFMAEKASIFLAGVLIYIACRLFGYGIEKFFVNRVKGLWKVNRIGGALLGGLKATAIIALSLFFLALIPVDLVRGWVPRMLESRAYRFAASHNPMGKQATLERMRQFRATMSDPKKMSKLKSSPDLNAILSEYQMKDALNDGRFVDSIRQGDYEQIQKVERVEELMNDEKLSQILTKLDRETN